MEIKFIGGHPEDRDKIFFRHTVKRHQISETKPFNSLEIFQDVLIICTN